MVNSIKMICVRNKYERFLDLIVDHREQTDVFLNVNDIHSMHWLTKV